MTHQEIAAQLKDLKETIVLIYAFNATGKTRLSVAYKDATKAADGTHSGVYYNAFSEDLFVWDNDEENNGANILLKINPSSLSKFHGSLTELDVRKKLTPYRPKYEFYFDPHKNPEQGFQHVRFFMADNEKTPIKISRGEERIFVWCFFLALFEIGGWTDKQSSHFFIDDPVSSLDDHNIFVTASTLYDLIEAHYINRRIIVTTHHFGLFSILGDWLTKGEKADKFRDGKKSLVKFGVLTNKAGDLALESCRDDVLLYHLRLLQILTQARDSNSLRSYHMALLRQALENVASFLGIAQFRYVLEQIDIGDATKVSNIINSLSHKRVYYFETDDLTSDDRATIEEVLEKLQAKYHFVLHAT